MVLNAESGTTKPQRQPMPWKDAAIVALILAVAGFFTAFLPGYTYERIVADLGLFGFESIRYVGSTFFTYFLVLSGISRLTDRE